MSCYLFYLLVTRHLVQLLVPQDLRASFDGDLDLSPENSEETVGGDAAASAAAAAEPEAAEPEAAATAAPPEEGAE